jgi:hypothetical protein
MWLAVPNFPHAIESQSGLLSMSYIHETFEQRHAPLQISDFMPEGSDLVGVSRFSHSFLAAK